VSGLRVVLLPGVVLPAELAYAALLDALGEDVDAVAKELELYAAPRRPDEYDLELEVDGVLRLADARGWERFHLVGYSAGGAASLAFAAARPERLASLALLEPAWAGNRDQSAAEQAVWIEEARLEELPDERFVQAFMRLGLEPGVPLPPPPPGDPPPWLPTRPAGIRALTRAFRQRDVDLEALRRFERPVYVALGALSNQQYYGEIARRVAGVFPDCELEVFEERHHFDPPHRIEPERLAASLRALWRRADATLPK
jgi:pimeloyl-ACP methyl ester carboxylesterase